MNNDITVDDLRTTVKTLRAAAHGRLCDDRQRLWPDVSDREFHAVVDALGEISVVEARTVLARLQAEAKG